MDSCGCIRPIKKRVQMGFWRVKKKVSYTQDVRSADFPPEQISPGCNEVWELVGEIGYYYSSDNGMQSTFVTTGNLFWIRLDCKILFTSFPVLLHPPTEAAGWIWCGSAGWCQWYSAGSHGDGSGPGSDHRPAAGHTSRGHCHSRTWSAAHASCAAQRPGAAVPLHTAGFSCYAHVKHKYDKRQMKGRWGLCIKG